MIAAMITAIIAIGLAKEFDAGPGRYGGINTGSGGGVLVEKITLQVGHFTFFPSILRGTFSSAPHGQVTVVTDIVTFLSG